MKTVNHLKLYCFIIYQSCNTLASLSPPCTIDDLLMFNNPLRADVDYCKMMMMTMMMIHV